jgi:hypothetical protein
MWFTCVQDAAATAAAALSDMLMTTSNTVWGNQTECSAHATAASSAAYLVP